jgi:hypothetical protein
MRPDETDDAIADDDEDYCPECFGDDVIELPDGDLFCLECRAVIDY